MLNVQKSAYAFFIIILHVQHKLPASPFRIAAQGKGCIKRVYIPRFKSGQVGIFHDPADANLISYVVRVFYGFND